MRVGYRPAALAMSAIGVKAAVATGCPKLTNIPCKSWLAPAHLSSQAIRAGRDIDRRSRAGHTSDPVRDRVDSAGSWPSGSGSMRV